MSVLVGEETLANKRELRRVAVSSLMGTAIEWYDYFLYGLFAALVFNKLFFPNFDPVVGTILSLLSFSIGFVARPLGAIIFGHLGDRIGRRKTLIITLVLIGAATGCIGLLPTYETIGLAAPILLATLRFIQGLSVGGEWGGAVLMAVEHAPKEKRSIYGAMPQLGSPIGTLASSGAVALVTLLPEDQFMSWGWRLPFLLSFLLLGIALYVRLQVEESPVFNAFVKHEQRTQIPLAEVFKKAGGRVAIAVVMTLFASGALFIFTTYAVNHGRNVLGMEAWMLMLATMIGAVLEAVGIIIGGRLGDRFHPWKVVTWGGGAALVLTIPIVAMIGSGDPLLVMAAIALGIGMIGVPYGPLGTLLSQLFEHRYRYSGISICYGAAGMIGGFVPSLALAMSINMGASWTIGIILSVIMFFTVVGGLLTGKALGRTVGLEAGQ